MTVAASRAQGRGRLLKSLRALIRRALCQVAASLAQVSVLGSDVVLASVVLLELVV